MANHVLSLEIPEVSNTCIIKIIDTSVYSEYVALKCPVLLVTPPGFNRSIVFEESRLFPGNIGAGFYFNLNLTACDLELQKDDCGNSYNNLPDGIYIIKYSVSPNETVYVEYNHLRISKALRRYNNLLCELELSDCEPPKDIKDKLNYLTLIKRYIDAAKAKVEYCHEPEKGITLFNYAVKLLDKLDCKTC